MRGLIAASVEFYIGHSRRCRGERVIKDVCVSCYILYSAPLALALSVRFAMNLFKNSTWAKEAAGDWLTSPAPQLAHLYSRIQDRLIGPHFYSWKRIANVAVVHLAFLVLVLSTASAAGSAVEQSPVVWWIKNIYVPKYKSLWTSRPLVGVAVLLSSVAFSLVAMALFSRTMLTLNEERLRLRRHLLSSLVSAFVVAVLCAVVAHCLAVIFLGFSQRDWRDITTFVCGARAVSTLCPLQADSAGVAFFGPAIISYFGVVFTMGISAAAAFLSCAFSFVLGLSFGAMKVDYLLRRYYGFDQRKIVEDPVGYLAICSSVLTFVLGFAIGLLLLFWTGQP